MPQRKDSSLKPPAARSDKVPRSRRQAVKRRRAVRRIPLRSLEALLKSEVQLGNKLLSLLPAPVPGERLLDELADETARLVGMDHDIFFHTMRTYAGSEFNMGLDDLFVTTARLAPDPGRAVLAADMTLVGSWLEELLEDEPPEARTLPPPTPRDFGLVTFILMQLVNWLCQRGLPPLSMPSAAPNLETVAQRLRRQTEIVELVYAVTSPRSAGLVRLLIPSDMVQRMEVFVAEASRCERRRKRLMLSRLGELRASVVAAVAVAPLTRDELDGLRAGDIILPTQHGLRANPLEDETGAGRLLLGTAGKSHLPCIFRRRGGQIWQIEITDVTPHIHAFQGAHMSTEQSEVKDAGKKQATGVLEHAEVEVEVRVGAMPLPVAVLAEIQSGYVLEMERRIDDGVDLVIDGATVGSGELVNVDGKLGVRVLSIED